MSWDQHAESWDTNAAVIAYADKAYQSLNQAVKDVDLELAGLRVLDFGAGTGLLCERLVGQVSEIIALDSSTNMLAVLANKQLANVSVLNAELSEQVIADNTSLQSQFDLILASSALAFVDDFPHCLRLLKGLLKPTGILLQWDWLKETEQAGAGFSQAELDVAYRQVGFSTFSSKTAFSLEADNEDMPVIMVTAENG